MTHYARDAIVDQFLRDGDSGLRVGGIVLRIQCERHRLPADTEFLCVEILDRESHAVFVVLADVRQFASQGRYLADPDRDIRLGQKRLCREHHHQKIRGEFQIFHARALAGFASTD